MTNTDPVQIFSPLKTSKSEVNWLSSKDVSWRNISSHEWERTGKKVWQLKKPEFLLSSKHCAGSPKTVLNMKEMAEITDIEFRIWMTTKIIKIQEKIESHSKELKESRKIIQEIKAEIFILKQTKSRDKTEKLTTRIFNTVGSINSNIDQAEEKNLTAWRQVLLTNSVSQK